MKRLDRFILTSFVGPFIAILLIVVFILMMQFLWLYIDELVGKGLGLRIILEFLFWGICSQALPLALPLSTLLASLMTLGQMGENSELIAMKASGISLSRIMAPLMTACAAISVCAFFALNNLSPYATNKIYTLRDDIGKTKEEIKIPVGTFYDGIEGYVLRVESRHERTGMMYGVIVYDHSNHKGNTSMTVADSGLITMSKAKDYLMFQLWDGSNYQETNTRQNRDTTRALQRVDFKKQTLIIPLSNYAFEKSEGTRFDEQVRSMNLRQLFQGRDSLEIEAERALVKHLQDGNSQSRLRYSNQLDSAWNVRFRADFRDTAMTWKDLSREIQAYEQAASNARMYESTLRSYSYEAWEYVYILRRTRVEIWNKFSQALACLILFFIGAPLGALVRKGGLGTSAIISVLFFTLWWVIYISGTKLARDGASSAFVGTFLCNFALLAIGVYLTHIAIHDSSFMGGDSFKAWWRKVWSRILSFFKKTRIVFMGTPEFAVASLDALVQAGYKVTGVVTAPDKPSGRGLQVRESPVKQYAAAHGIPVLQPEKLKDPAFLEELAALRGDLFVVVGFRMLPEAVWSLPKLGTFNLHAALLPQYRGAAPIQWAVINGESLTGVTTFMIDKNIDTGGIILRQESRIGAADTAGDVHDRLMSLGADLVVQTVEGLIQNNVETRVQRSFIQGSELLKPAPKLTRALCHIDWNDTSRHVYNLIRGLSPYPAAFTELVREGEAPQTLKVFFGECVEGAACEELLRLAGLRSPSPGTVLSDGKSVFAIATADGAVALTDLQLSGKKRMKVQSFLAGFRDPMSYRTVPGASRAEIEKAKPAEE